jgi:hypothetical protein
VLGFTPKNVTPEMVSDFLPGFKRVTYHM